MVDASVTPAPVIRTPTIGRAEPLAIHPVATTSTLTLYVTSVQVSSEVKTTGGIVKTPLAPRVADLPIRNTTAERE